MPRGNGARIKAVWAQVQTVQLPHEVKPSRVNCYFFCYLFCSHFPSALSFFHLSLHLSWHFPCPLLVLLRFPPLSSFSLVSDMRRFSSEGSLLDLDVLPWRRVGLLRAEQGQEGCHVVETYTPHLEEDESPLEAPAPVMSSRGRGRELVKEHSVSVENITDLDKAAGALQSPSLNDSYRAYSDSQLAPDPTGSRDSVGPDAPSSPSSAKCHPLSTMSLHSHHARARLSAAKLHLKSLFSVTLLPESLSVCMCL